MIRYCVIVPVLLIYSHSTNAETSFSNNVEEIKGHLRAETASPSSSRGNHENILCEKLTLKEKQSVCDQIMDRLVLKEHENKFESFVDSSSSIFIPPLGNGDLYKVCKDKFIEELNIEKPMLWCNRKLFKTNRPDDYDMMEGFFCAGSQTAGRVYAFRQVSRGNQEVRPVAELNNVGIILRRAARAGGSK